tara:strand:+ start:1527 stop:2150 length:624 start_codon:yes stop_codon:yes gene_type:complete
MSNFNYVEASLKSIAKRKLVCGVGINDSDTAISNVIDGRLSFCPFYKVWHSMIVRCYSPKNQKSNPAYKGCSVSCEWLTFSNFKSWMSNQEWQGMELDKDILIQGNKTYSAKACIFVTKSINSLLCSKPKGKNLQGVSYYKITGRFRAQCKHNGVNKCVGYYATPEDAHEAYKEFKYGIIKEVAMTQAEPLKSALLSYKINATVSSS